MRQVHGIANEYGWTVSVIDGDRGPTLHICPTSIAPYTIVLTSEEAQCLASALISAAYDSAKTPEFKSPYEGPPGDAP